MLALIFLCMSFNLFSYYQDVCINNNIVEKGERKCEPTYTLIKKFLTNYKRDFTILDLGAAQGFFSFKIGYEFPHSTCVMIEADYDYNNHTDKLLELCVKNSTLDNIIFLKNSITPDLLQTIAECEHFDVVLALNFIHHCGQNWKAIIEKICSLGDYVIIENPPFQEASSEDRVNRQGIEDFIAQHGGVLLGEVPRHTSSLYTAKVFLIKTNKSKLIQKNIFWGNRFLDKTYAVESDFSEKKLIKSWNATSIATKWHKGINLLTFKALNGVFPFADTIGKLLYDQAHVLSLHKDLTPANIILQGKKIQVIDCDDFHYGSFNRTESSLKARNKATLEKINTFLNLYNYASLYEYYWTELPKS